MSVFHKSGSGGFTLIELMITIAIFSITLTLGVSSYRTWVQNTQIRNAAESIQNGIQRARAEAVKRNANVAFTLGAQSSWAISVVSSGEQVESRSGNEGSKNVTVAVEPAGATTITFSNLGTVVPAADTLTRVDLDSSVLDAADSRDLSVTVSIGGNVRVCDPNLDPDTSKDPRRCY